MRIFIIVTAILFATCTVSRHASSPSLPSWLKGNFEDDYGIKYTVSDSLFTLLPAAKYHILEWNETEEYIIARNDEKNPGEQNLFTRIDYMQFKNMDPYMWGFCLTTYNAASPAAAKSAPAADRANPRKGCNNFSFSRMKRIDVKY